MVLVGEYTTALVLNVEINRTMTYKVLSVTFAVFVGSMLASYVFDKKRKDKPFEFIVKFQTTALREEVFNMLDQEGIYCKRKSKRVLIIDSYSKEDSRKILNAIEDKYVSCKMNELKKIIVNN